MIDRLREKKDKLKNRHDIKDWSPLIEDIFGKLDYEIGMQFKSYDNRYVCYSILTEDENSMSCIIFKSNGNMKVWNGDVKVIRKEMEVSTSSITVSEWTRMAGYMDDYIEFVLHMNEIDSDIFNVYKRHLKTFLNTGTWGTSFENCIALGNFRKKILKYYYIKDDDVVGSDVIKSSEEMRTRFSSNRLAPKTADKISILEKIPTPDFYNVIKNKMEKRKIPIIENVCFPIMVSMGSTALRPAICFRYPNGFTKYRFIFPTDSGDRYRTNDFEGKAKYESFYEPKVSKTDLDTCFVVEGEIEGLAISKYTEHDVYCLHNTNSLPNVELSQLQQYTNIYVKLDYDSFECSMESIKLRIEKDCPLSNVVVLPKIICENKSIDYNRLDVLGALSTDIIDKFSIDKTVRLWYNVFNEKIKYEEEN